MRHFRNLALALAVAAALLLACSPAPTPTPTPEVGVDEVRIFARDNQFDPQEIKIKALRSTRIKITSFDGEYQIESPGLGIPRTRIPSLGTAQVSIMPVRLGAYEFYNVDRLSMKGTIVVQACPPEAETVKSPVAATEESLRLGKALYNQNCAACHGAGGQGDGPAAASLQTKPIDFTKPYMAKITEGEMFWVVSKGWEEMPPFENKLDETQRWHLVNYIRSLVAKS